MPGGVSVQRSREESVFRASRIKGPNSERIRLSRLGSGRNQRSEGWGASGVPNQKVRMRGMSVVIVGVVVRGLRERCWVRIERRRSLRGPQARDGLG